VRIAINLPGIKRFFAASEALTTTEGASASMERSNDARGLV
jgi:hypothetical protein